MLDDQSPKEWLADIKHEYGGLASHPDMDGLNPPISV